MRPYERRLRNPSRRLRCRASAAEQRLWHWLRRKQVCGVPFYRQKPLLGYIVDFYAPAAGLVIEVDGAQHLTEPGRTADARRTADLEALGLRVIRFDNLQVLTETVAVMEQVYRVVRGRLEGRAEGQRLNPPCPPFSKGGTATATATADGGISRLGHGSRAVE